MEPVTLGVALCGSFCTYERVFAALRALKVHYPNMIPILSFAASSVDSRFGSAQEHRQMLEQICGSPARTTLAEVEPIGPKKQLDLLLIAPCTGNTLAKLAAGIADTPVTLAAKSHLRNERPLLLSVSSNDALGANAPAIGALLGRKHVYFVPFGQDDPVEKPRSLAARLDCLPEAVAAALEERQLQPILR